MKSKLAVLAFLAAAMSAAASPSWAFTSTGISTITAGTFVGGQRVARYTLAIKDTSNPFGATRSSITWSGVSAGASWKLSDQLLVLNSTVTDNNGGVQIYTDNTASDALPQFVDPTPGTPTNPDSAAAGLLKGTAGQTSEVLPMAWSIKSSTKIVEGGTAATGIGATDPNTGPITGRDNKFQWLFVTDKSNTSGIDFNGDGDVLDTTAGDSSPFVNGSAFASMVRVNGLTSNQNADIEALQDGKDAFVYMQANFTAAAAQQAYQTTTLRVEAYIQ